MFFISEIKINSFWVATNQVNETLKQLKTAHYKANLNIFVKIG